jgi:hypothetical protein
MLCFRYVGKKSTMLASEESGFIPGGRQKGVAGREKILTSQVGLAEAVIWASDSKQTGKHVYREDLRLRDLQAAAACSVTPFARLLGVVGSAVLHHARC